MNVDTLPSQGTKSVTVETIVTGVATNYIVTMFNNKSHKMQFWTQSQMASFDLPSTLTHAPTNVFLYITCIYDSKIYDNCLH